MSSKTKIIVLHMKEVIYTLVFLFFLLILGIVLFFMFGPGRSAAASMAKGRYVPGIYRSSVTLNDNNFDVEVTVDTNRITSIELVNLSETTSAMFPLMEPALESLASQIYTSQSVEGLTYENDRKYTSMVLLHAIEDALKKAESF